MRLNASGHVKKKWIVDFSLLVQQNHRVQTAVILKVLIWDGSLQMVTSQDHGLVDLKMKKVIVGKMMFSK